MTPSDADSAMRPGGFLASLRRLISTLLEILQTRIEIVATELEEERLRIAQIAVAAFVTLFCLILAIIFGTLLIVVAFWETHRIAVLGGFAALYLALGVAAGLVWRARTRARTRLFATTLAELTRDRERLTPGR